MPDHSTTPGTGETKTPKHYIGGRTCALRHTWENFTSTVCNCGAWVIADDGVSIVRNGEPPAPVSPAEEPAKCPGCGGTREKRLRINPLGSWAECVNVFHAQPSAPSRETTQREEWAWDAYRAGYLAGRSEQDTAWRGYEHEVAHAESRATAYTAVRRIEEEVVEGPTE